MSDVTDAFLIAVNMSLTASAIILVVVLARLALKRAPRWCSYALWSVVLFRLLCPVSIGSAFSVLNLSRTPVVSAAGRVTAVNYVESIPGLEPGDVAPAPSLAPSVTAPSGGLTPQDVGASVDWIGVLAWLWVIVAAAMLLWALVSYLSLRVRLWDSAVLEGRVRVSRRIDTAFVAGMLRPRIYLPEGLSERERECVLAHERGHIRRGDHLMKPLAYVALCLHWFNPLVWLAWVLAMRDMESSCDEAALRRLGSRRTGGLRPDPAGHGHTEAHGAGSVAELRRRHPAQDKGRGSHAPRAALDNGHSRGSVRPGHCRLRGEPLCLGPLRYRAGLRARALRRAP